MLVMWGHDAICSTNTNSHTQLPSPSKFFRNLCIVFVGSHFNNLSSFQLGPNHEGIHGSFDVIGCVLFGLQEMETFCHYNCWFSNN